jgi:ferredoxin-NADP reductase/anaerobic selenocysteine-containing dehydrogenase
MTNVEQIVTLEHAGMLEDLLEMPAYVRPDHAHGHPHNGRYSCCFCGVGDSGTLLPAPEAEPPTAPEALGIGTGQLKIERRGEAIAVPAELREDGRLVVTTAVPLVPPGGVLTGTFQLDGAVQTLTAREVDRQLAPDGSLVSQSFVKYRRAMSVSDSVVKQLVPTTGCVKLKNSLMRQRPAFPIHTVPSRRDHEHGGRQPLTYNEAISRLADLLLAHRPPKARSLVYACGQIDYFTIFAMQEVFRLLGMRNLTGNAEHCLNSGAVHNEILTGQEGPFMTVEQGLHGPHRFYLLNGWNGLVTHPPAFHAVLKREDLDAYLVEVMETESAKALSLKLGPERVLFIKPRSDAHLALAVAHEMLTQYPQAVEQRFIQRYADAATFTKYATMARSDTFAPAQVAARIAPEPAYVERLIRGIQTMAARLVQPEVVPINIPSVGLSQTSGVVAHCLWGSLLAMLGKYGLKPDGSPAGGTLRLPGQINAESEVQGLSRRYFMGRIHIEEAAEAARRMGLPEDAYDLVQHDTPRAALDYSDPTPGVPELMLCFGTQFESNMIERPRWLRKLQDPETTLVVVDPVPDPFSLEHADLIIPSPPHPATTKLYQNGEWKLSLAIPQKQAPPETRTDATIIYDTMAEIARRLESDPAVAAAHPDLARHARSGYLRQRFAGHGLPRVDGEVSRAHLFHRIIEYMSGGSGPLYCRPEHPDGRPIAWEELLEQGSIIYGGVGSTRYRLDYDLTDHMPFSDIYRRPRRFTFFTPTEADLHIPQGVILNSGRSPLSDDPERVRFAISTFNSGKATPTVNMPEANPLHVSPLLAGQLGLKTGDVAKVTNAETRQTLCLPVLVTDRVKGESTYVSFHKCRTEIEAGQYINTVTSHTGRCPYSGQTQVKATQILLERVAVAIPGVPPVDTTLIDPEVELPAWQGQTTPLYVTDIIQETPNVYTFRFQGQPLCRFAYWPGQYCSLVLNIDGKKVVRSYTISSPPSRPYILEITVKRVPGGLVSNWLPDHLQVGDKVEIAGPKGKFCLQPGKIPPKMLFIAGGSGVTPMMSMSRWLCDVSANVDIRFFYSVWTPEDIIFRRELELLTSRYKMFTPLVVTTTRGTGDGWMGLTGRVERRMLESLASDLHERHVYMCGPEGFMDAVKAILGELNFDMADLHIESFGGLRTSVADKSAPAMVLPGLAATVIPPTIEPEVPTGTITVEFARSRKKTLTDGRMSLLDVAEHADVDLEYGCRMGSCGDCKVRLLAGNVVMETEEGLQPDDKAAGYVLTCVGRPVGSCTLEA